MTERDNLWSALKLLALRAGASATYQQAAQLLDVRRYLLLRLMGRTA